MWRRSAGLWKPGEGRIERWSKAGRAGEGRGEVQRCGSEGEGKRDASAAEGTERFEVIGLGRK